ncbi:MAG: CinA family nicotinamide mononucleotide deamidase-related protein [Candidatus Tectomicrobia bacterium]|nr:CinA family nicotinamide mononucleotide deamidase-related protein [Candidatus Tectomicrobia bacterium]
MRAEIVSVGSEILLGDLVDTNSAYLAQQLKQLGINVYQKTSVGDNQVRLRDVLRAAASRSDLVITTGGIGPTVDDVTRAAAAEAAGVKLEFRQDLLDEIEAMFRKRNFKLTPNNRKQAFIPRGSEAIHNPVGTAPGFIVKVGDAYVVALPGVPHEMKHLMHHVVLPFLQEHCGIRATLVTRTLKLVGIGESHVDAQIHDLLSMGPNPTVGILAKQDGIEVRITARGEDELEARQLIAPVEGEVRRRLGEKVYGADAETIEEVVAGLLAERKLSLALLETLSAGGLSQRLHSARQAEPFLHETIIAARPAAQRRALEVPEQLYAEFGDSSREVAEALAAALRRRSGADLALCVLGSLEDDGSPRDRYLARTYTAIAAAHGASCRDDTYGGPIPFIKHRVALQALERLRRFLLDYTD